jgi:hypothetical protein
MRKIIDGLGAVVIWCLCAGVVIGIGYVLSPTDDPGFETKQECEHVLFQIQWKNGHHGEECDELDNGHWKIFDINGDAL